ncbi:MAG: 4Fe-4S dicluster domain-containing protein [Chloroflexi bacterium]|nr:4Fe-4S dicluster domain-containing protein [Chloroflexota bacterium]
MRLCGLTLRNPVLPAAGPPVWNAAAMLACVAGGAGGIVSKTISTTAAQVPQPCMAEVSHGSMLNSELWAELPPEHYLAHEFPQARTAGVPLVVSLGYSPQEIAHLAPQVRPFADAVELSTHYIGDDPAPMVGAIRAAKAALDVPVWVKFSPFRDVRRAAQAAREAGADAIVAVNSYGPCLGINLETGQPLVGSREGYGWLSGAALKPIALRCVFDIAQTVDLPVIGVGGISSGEDAIEFFMAGASAVQVCTAAILRGPGVFGEIAAGIEAWLSHHGYSSVEEVRGLAQRRLRERPFRTQHVPPTLQVEDCIGCTRCVVSCVYGALEMTGQPKTKGYKVRLHPDRCAGCGLCATRCPTQALRMPGVSAQG